jgi:hypothetical protein
VQRETPLPILVEKTGTHDRVKNGNAPHWTVGIDRQYTSVVCRRGLRVVSRFRRIQFGLGNKVGRGDAKGCGQLQESDVAGVGATLLNVDDEPATDIGLPSEIIQSPAQRRPSTLDRCAKCQQICVASGPVRHGSTASPRLIRTMHYVALSGDRRPRDPPEPGDHR